MSRQHLAGLGQTHVAPHSFDQHRSGALLEPAYHLGDGWLGVAQRQGGQGEATLVGNGAHHAQPRCINHACKFITLSYRLPNYWLIV